MVGKDITELLQLSCQRQINVLYKFPRSVQSNGNLRKPDLGCRRANLKGQLVVCFSGVTGRVLCSLRVGHGACCKLLASAYWLIALCNIWTALDGRLPVNKLM